MLVVWWWKVVGGGGRGGALQGRRRFLICVRIRVLSMMFSPTYVKPAAQIHSVARVRPGLA